MDEDKVNAIKSLLLQHRQHEYIVALAKDVPLSVEPINAGHLNYVGRVKSADGSKSCFFKVYVNYAKFLGPTMPVDLERCQRESEASHFFRSLYPDCCPEHYFFDEVNHIGFLEDFPEHQEWGQVLRTHCDLWSGSKIVDMLVTIHSSSHRGKLTSSEFLVLQEKFRGLPQQANFLCECQFVKPFQANHRQYKPGCHRHVRQRVDEVITENVVLRASEKARRWMSPDNGDCCIHGDMHLENVFYNLKERHVMLIDTDCARVGPEAYDVGLLVSNYILLLHYHQEMRHGQPNHLMTGILDLITITLNRYMDGMGCALGNKFDGPKVWRKILVFMALEIIGWISGPASFDYIDSQPAVMVKCLDTALKILQQMPTTMEELSKIILQEPSHLE